MIKLEDIFDQLAYGEFLSIDLGADGCKGLSVDDYPKIAVHINLALTELYKRFNLKMGKVAIQLFDEITDYKIHSIYAQSNTASEEPVKWIADLGDSPYTDDLLKIERVYNEIGCELTLNDPSDCKTINTPEYNVIQCSYPYDENTLLVRYRAAPVYIPTKKLIPENIYVPIPPSLVEALLWYVAGRIMTNLNLAGDIGEGNNYTMKFEKSIQEVKLAGLINEDKATNLKPEKRKWV